jgi:phosphatidylinositol-3-phosphatase
MASGLAAIGLAIFCRLTLAAAVADGALRQPDVSERIPRPDHVVIVIEENKAYRQIIGSATAPYINRLAREGALFTQSFAVAHPSQPNYLALFAGTTHGVVDDRCLASLSGDNLASELKRRGLSFATYSESLPVAGFTGCRAGHYARKHNPAVNWQDVNLAPGVNLPFSAFPADYAKLPTVSLVVPNQINDMHNGPPPQAIRRGDRWLEDHLDAYVRWAARHNSLLILTWDEDDGSSGNRIVTIFAGPMVRRGVYDAKIDHYNVLRTLMDMYDLRPLGETAGKPAIRNIWRPESPRDRSEAAGVNFTEADRGESANDHIQPFVCAR